MKASLILRHQAAKPLRAFAVLSRRMRRYDEAEHPREWTDLNLEFHLGRDLDVALQEVQTKLAQAPADHAGPGSEARNVAADRADDGLTLTYVVQAMPRLTASASIGCSAESLVVPAYSLWRNIALSSIETFASAAMSLPSGCASSECTTPSSIMR